MRFRIFLMALAIIALSGCIRHIPQENRQAFAPQAATISGAATQSGASVTGEVEAPPPAEAVVETDCAAYCAAIQAASGVIEPFEVQDTQYGDGCLCYAPKLKALERQ